MFKCPDIPLPSSPWFILIMSDTKTHFNSPGDFMSSQHNLLPSSWRNTFFLYGCIADLAYFVISYPRFRLSFAFFNASSFYVFFIASILYTSLLFCSSMSIILCFFAYSVCARSCSACLIFYSIVIVWAKWSPPKWLVSDLYFLTSNYTLSFIFYSFGSSLIFILLFYLFDLSIFILAKSYVLLLNFSRIVDSIFKFYCGFYSSLSWLLIFLLPSIGFFWLNFWIRSVNWTLLAPLSFLLLSDYLKTLNYSGKIALLFMELWLSIALKSPLVISSIIL